MDFKKLIEQNQVSELSALVFNQHFDNSSQDGYTCPLSAKNEVLAVTQMLQTHSAEWYDFLARYLEHYPLSPEADDILADNAAEDSQACELLLLGMNKFGCPPVLGEHLCRYFLATQADGQRLILSVCNNSRIRSSEVRTFLERLADREHASCPEENPPQYVELYDKAVSTYHSTRL